MDQTEDVIYLKRVKRVKKDADEIFTDYVLSELRGMDGEEQMKAELRQFILLGVTACTNEIMRKKYGV